MCFAPRKLINRSILPTLIFGALANFNVTADELSSSQNNDYSYILTLAEEAGITYWCISMESTKDLLGTRPPYKADGAEWKMDWAEYYKTVDELTEEVEAYVEKYYSTVASRQTKDSFKFGMWQRTFYKYEKVQNRKPDGLECLPHLPSLAIPKDRR